VELSLKVFVKWIFLLKSEKQVGISFCTNK
jgi:hypothetical protein